MIKKDCRQSSRRSPRDGYCILADVISTEMGLLSPCHSTICHSAKFDMLVAALVNRCIECGLHLILNKQGPTGEKYIGGTKGCNYLFCLGLIGPHHSI